ncbi:MFS transporter [Streptomyces milbemycinicus]|uniref:MFS transporter n=1 Tax=Streptomyces milbemycinicus TaxID=476552 RepID=UPI0033E247F9
MFAALYVATGTPTPLLVVFEQQRHFPAWVLTVAFASYTPGLLAALLVAGPLSDHTGPRPVLIGTLAVELGTMPMFVFASNIGWVIAARTIQGIATGTTTSTLSTPAVEHAPQHHKKLGRPWRTVASLVHGRRAAWAIRYTTTTGTPCDDQCGYVFLGAAPAAAPSIRFRA